MIYLRHSSSKLFHSFEFQGHSSAGSLIFFWRGTGRLAQFPISLPWTQAATRDPSDSQRSGNREARRWLLYAPQAPLILAVHPKLDVLRACSSKLAVLSSPRALRHQGPTTQHRGADGLRAKRHCDLGGGWGPVPGLWRLLDARLTRPRPALTDGAHAPPVAAGGKPSLLLRVALRGATFGFGVLRTGWGRRGSDRGTEVGKPEHCAQPSGRRAVGQPERQRHLRAGARGAAGRPALCALTSRVALSRPWRHPASSRPRPRESWPDTSEPPPRVTRWNGDPPRGPCPYQVAWEGPVRRKNQFQPERPAQAIDTSVPGRVNRVLPPRFTCK